MKNLFPYPAKSDEKSDQYTYVREMSQEKRKSTPTTIVERVLLLVTIAILPLQTYIPTVAGIGALFIVFAGLGGYVLLVRPRSLLTTMRHPVFLAGYVFLGVGIFMEVAHESSGYSELLRMVFMLMGAVFVASLCRDRMALLFSMYGFLVSGIWIAGVLFLTTYSQLSSVQLDDFQNADRFRYEVFGAGVLGGDLNDIAFVAGRGALVALVLALTTSLPRRRYTFLAIGTFCLVATFLPMSRSGLINFAVAFAAVLYAYGAMRPRILIAVGVLAIGVFTWVPDAVYTRYSFSTEKQAGEFADSRSQIYTAVITHLPEYVWTGVGISHYWGDWGKRRSGFDLRNDGSVMGTHNCFAQVMVYWGLPGLLAILMVVWQAYRCVPRPCSADALRLCLLGIAVSVFVFAMVLHILAAKEFSLALGLLVGSAQWIWPQHAANRLGFRGERAPMLHVPRKERFQWIGVSRLGIKY